ncbi:MAG: protein phosphatase 2C domain-containing protein [Oscillospiraceae bacterium]|nr:protein phosphatase 2C domain-containing protein [Oscillospiraceae bacterium]
MKKNKGENTKSEKPLIIRAAAKCKGSDVRANEDNIFFNGDYIQEAHLDEVYEIKSGKPLTANVFAVCDGMGKSNSGSEASSLAVVELSSLFEDLNGEGGVDADEIVLEYINDVNEAIGMRSQKLGVRSATTLALLVIENETAHIYNLGDTRIYLQREDEFIQVTRDHLPRRGEQTDSSFDNKVSQFLGIYDNERELVPFRAKPIPIQAGDRFLIVSDGVSDYVEDSALDDKLAANKDPFVQCSEIVKAAEMNSSRDSMSVVVVHVSKQKVQITSSMIMGIIGLIILIVGFALGYLVGYIYGSAVYGVEGKGSQTTISSEPVSSEELESDEVSSEEDVSSEEVSSSSEVKATKVGFPAGKDKFTLDPGETLNLKTKFTVKPEGADTGKLKWKSSNTAVATVDENGIVKMGSKAGSARITVTPEYGDGGWCEVECRVVAPAVTTTKKTTTKTTTTAEAKITTKQAATTTVVPVVTEKPEEQN